MRRYVNKSRFLKRIVFRSGTKVETVFLGQGQHVDHSGAVKHMDDGIRVTEAKPVAQESPKKAKKDSNEGKENI